MASQSERLAALWRRTARLPGGSWLFSRLFGRAVPYSDSIKATVERLEPGFCRVRLRDRRRVRNHLDSIHAVALVNLGEMTSGLAMTMALPGPVRGIATEIGASYLKKARGELIAEARVMIPTLGAEPVDTRVEAVISDRAGDVVCRVSAVWRLERRGGPTDGRTSGRTDGRKAG